MKLIKGIFRQRKLEIVLFERDASAGGRKGGLGGIPPALQILGKISSNFFERTPPVRKCHFSRNDIFSIIQAYYYATKFLEKAEKAHHGYSANGECH